MTGGQVYEARLLLGWSVKLLSKKTGLARSCIRRIESQRHSWDHIKCLPSTESAIVDTFRDEGVAFIDLDGLPWIQIIERSESLKI